MLVGRSRIQFPHQMIFGPRNGFKVCTVGCHNVGKTTIINRFAKNMFCKNPLPTIQPILTQTVTLVDGKGVRLNIWDTAGQEKFKSTVPLYLKNAHCVICVFDVSEPETFENVKTWIECESSELEKNPLVIICGNKSDLDSSVDEEAVKSFADSREVKYFFTSARKGTNIKDMFTYIASALLDRFSDETEVTKAEGRGHVCGC